MRALVFIVSAALLSACGGSGLGDACKKTSDCSGDDLNYCARARICTRPCGIDTPVGPPGHPIPSDCPNDFSCVQEGPRLVCLKTCKDSNDCPAMFICTNEGTASVCELAQPLAQPPS